MQKRRLDTHTPLLETVVEIIEPPLNSMGYDLVRVQLSGAKHKTLQIMIANLNGNIITVDDCAKISREISTLLDVEDPIKDAYTLEVSSPGITPPLTRIKDFFAAKGHKIKLELALPLDGRKRFQGIIANVDDDMNIHLALPDEENLTLLPFDTIQKAHLMETPNA